MHLGATVGGGEKEVGQRWEGFFVARGSYGTNDAQGWGLWWEE